MSASTEDVKKEEEIVKYPLVTIRGWLFPSHAPLPKVIEGVMDFKPIDSDIFIVTYPKCGTTWTQFLVWEIMHKGAVPPSPNQIMFQHMPFLEFTGTDILETLPHPRVMKTHLPFHLQPYNPLAKYIYIVRNPWDCCVSYYYHHCIDPSMPNLSFDQYFNLFITGELGWGDFFDHVLSWFEHRDDPNVLFLTYEDMKKNTRQVMLKIAKFLGDSYYEDLQDETVLENCLRYSDFKNLKKMGMFFPKMGQFQEQQEDIIRCMGEVDRENLDKNFEEVQFFRKGVVGDWKNHFSQEHIKLFNIYLISKQKDTAMENFWKPLEEETAL